MSWFKFDNWILAAGVMLAVFGIANAASVVSATISAPTKESFGLVDRTDAFPKPAGDAKPGFATDPKADTLAIPVSEAVEIDPSESQITSRLLAEHYELEMMYPDDIAERVVALSAAIAPEIPTRMLIPTIELDAPILPVEAELVRIAGKDYQIWRAPDEFGVGWHASSAPLGVVGNTVLNGHHNFKGEVFKNLEALQPGDEVVVQSEDRSYRYVIVNRMILAEKYALLEQRVENAQWLLPSKDERLTLITCWPYESNTHRLVLVAKPVSVEN
jgi:LPXTG-site transpeptidase (sortase) family protein